MDDRANMEEESMVLATENPSILLSKIRELPHKPGVYLYKDRLGRVIYVGKARDLKKRVSQYFHPSKRLRADLKTRALIECICDLQTFIVRTEPEAILLEGRLIKEYRPKYNIDFRDDKRFLMVKVNLNEPFPRFTLTRIRKEDGARYFGPFAYPSALRRTLNLMKKLFHLRSCSPFRPTERDYRHCLDHIIKNCSAPCMAKISEEDYKKNVAAACDFLEGQSKEMLKKMEEEMQEAAEKLQFEKAAELRNMLDAIRQTTKPQRRFMRDIPSTIETEKDVVELGTILQLNAPPQHIECFDISNISTTHKVASMVSFRNGKPYKEGYRRYRISTVEGQDDFASMAEVVQRRYSRVLREGGRMPDLIVVDGGKGQLNSALQELLILGIKDQPIIGLAKQFEEIYKPYQSEPIRLPHSVGALKLLQRIRDEAHRFANAYHQLLMKKRVSESILDECEGISQKRKMALLCHFGSIEKIKKASIEELAQAPGISHKLAEQLFNSLQAMQNRSFGITVSTSSSD